MFAILRGANGRRHEVEFGDDPVTIDVAMSATTVQITMTAADPGDPAKGRFVTVAIPRDALATAMAAAAARPAADGKLELRLIQKDRQQDIPIAQPFAPVTEKPAKPLTKRAFEMVAEEGLEPPTRGL